MAKALRHRVLLALGLLALAIPGAAAARADGADEDRRRTEGLVVAYGRTDAWPVKAVALLSLGERWHPAGAVVVAEAFAGRDRRLRAYALEALRATAPEHLPTVLVPELLGELVERQLLEDDPRYRLNVLLLLARSFPLAGARTPAEWQAWWREVRSTYAPPPWQERPPGDPAAGDETTTVAADTVRRAFDLSQGGIQLVLVLDTTGSMQPTIDAVRAGIADLLAILSGLAPDLEVGLVQYRDREDLPDDDLREAGAAVVLPLTRDLDRLEDRLGTLVAGGGGDVPERVASGLWVALGRAMGWARKANKMVVVVGDAPPQEVERAVDLARQAHAEPESFLGRSAAVVTGSGATAAGENRPFVVSTVGVGPQGPANVTAEAFRRLAEAGGGLYVPFATAEPVRAASAEIVRRLVELSFGARHEAAARRFVDVYLKYRDAGYIRD